MIMKFSSTTLDAKASLDTKLSSITGELAKRVQNFRARKPFKHKGSASLTSTHDV